MGSSPFNVAVLAALAAFSVPSLGHGPIGGAATETTVPASAREAAAIVDAFHAGLRRQDTRAAAALLAEDALIFESGGVERSKAEYAAHHLKADAAFSQAVRSTVTRRQGSSSGKMAWVASEGRVSGKWKGKPVSEVTTESMILRRTSAGWKIVHIHWSSAPIHN